MNVDVFYKHKFYADTAQASILYQSEKSMEVYTGVLIRDNAGITRDVGFNCKVTSHRISMSCENSFKGQIDIPMKSIRSYTIQDKGFLHKKTYITLDTDRGVTFEFYHANIKDIYNTINASYNAKVWELANQLVTESQQIYSGMRGLKNQNQAEVRQIQASVGAGSSDVKTLVEKSEKLREIITYLKRNASGDQAQKTELDEILASIDEVTIVTKEEAGKNYYDELAKSIYLVSKELLNRYHGIASLVDVFYITNEKRKLALISPDDLLKACRKFEQLDLPIRLVELNKGLRVIQDVSFNSDEDFTQNIAPFIDESEGISADGLARRAKIPLLLALSKLELSLMKGKILLDDSIEGKRYFHNFIL